MLKAQKELVENHGVIILIIAFVILFIVLMLSYAGSHGLLTPEIPGNPFAGT